MLCKTNAGAAFALAASQPISHGLRDFATPQILSRGVTGSRKIAATVSS